MQRGDIAKKLGVQGAGCMDYSTNGTLDRMWAVRSSQEIVPEFPGLPKKFAVGGKDPTEISPKLSQEDAEERIRRVQEVDKLCLDALCADLGKESEWKSMLLLKDEEEFATLKCVAFQGMPSSEADSGLEVGDGMLTLTRINDSHRLHLVMAHSRASFDADEVWGEQTLGCLCFKTKATAGTSELRSDRAQDLTFVTLSLEGNLFHAHGGVQDSATLLSVFGGESKNAARNCSCGSCGSCCCSLRCCSLALACCSKSKNFEGSWAASTSFEDSLNVHIESLLLEDSKDATYKFPQTSSSVTGCEERALVAKQLRTINLIYRDPASNSIRTCVVVVKPSEPMKSIGSVTSKLGSLVTADPAPAKTTPWQLEPLVGRRPSSLAEALGQKSCKSCLPGLLCNALSSFKRFKNFKAAGMLS
jgi:hypothetical protein